MVLDEILCGVVMMMMVRMRVMRMMMMMKRKENDFMGDEVFVMDLFIVEGLFGLLYCIRFLCGLIL